MGYIGTCMCHGIGYGFWGYQSLKELCHEDYAVLAQYSTKIITLRL